LPRFSCANHKLNLAVRHAIKMHQPLCNALKALNSANAHVRRCIQLNSVFRMKKCRLRLENLTRWSSAYLMLESVKKAYDRDMFNTDNPELKCPIDLKTIEIYIQILKPCYLASIHFQMPNSSIADTIPTILQLISTYKKLSVTGSYKTLCSHLIKTLEKKFFYELKSSVYQVRNYSSLFMNLRVFIDSIKRLLGFCSIENFRFATLAW
jgi:hypothetical protein